MVRKNFHQYLISLQKPDDIYSKYRQHRKSMIDKVNLKNEAVYEVRIAAESALKEALERALNIKL